MTNKKHYQATSNRTLLVQLMDSTQQESERELAAREIERLSQLVKDLTHEVDAAHEERDMAYRELAAARDVHEARLVSYAPDGSTCTVNIAGVEHYFNAAGLQRGEPVAYMLEHERGRLDLTFRVDEVHERLGWTYKVHELYTTGSPDAERYRCKQHTQEQEVTCECDRAMRKRVDCVCCTQGDQK